MNRRKIQNCISSWQRGFTIIELMMVVALVAVVSMFGIPMYNDFVARRQVNAYVAQITSSVQLARSEAMTTGRTAGLCGTSNGISCNNGANWNQGWMVYVSGDASDDNVGRVVQVYPVNGNFEVTGTAGFYIRPSGLSVNALTVRVLPTGKSALGKTLSFERVTMNLEIVDGA